MSNNSENTYLLEETSIGGYQERIWKDGWIKQYPKCQKTIKFINMKTEIEVGDMVELLSISKKAYVISLNEGGYVVCELIENYERHGFRSDEFPKYATGDYWRTDNDHIRLIKKNAIVVTTCEEYSIY